MRFMWLIPVAWTFFSPLSAQDLPGKEGIEETVLEGLFDDYSSSDGGELNPEWLVFLEDLHDRPLDINTASESDLQVFFFLSGAQIDQLLAYRASAGPLLDPIEVQVIPGFDPATVRRLMPFIRAGSPDAGSHLQASHLWRTGKREVTLRMERFLEDKRGYQVSGDQPEPAYEGDPFRLLGRIRYVSGNKVSYGLTFEKDAGEALFTGSNRQGFDFLSGHIYMRNPFRGCTQVSLGDFGVNIGQGLLLSTGFGTGKSAAVTLIRRTGRRVYPQNGWQESRFFRGAAAEWAWSGHWRLLTFASIRDRDGNTVTIDSTDGEIPLVISSIQQSGLHRTEAEISDEGAFRETGGGASLQWQGPRTRIGLNGIHFAFSPPYQGQDLPYNQFRIRGDLLTAGSLDVQSTLRAGSIFGEAAWSHNGGFAISAGWMMSPSRHIQVAILARSFSRDYWTLWASPFAESTLPINEQGLYAAVEVIPVTGWKLSAYADLWRHHWLTYQSDSPVTGAEYLVRLSYEKRRRWSAYVQYRFKGREINQQGDTPSVADQIPTFRQQLRLQWQVDIHRVMSFRTRMEWTRADAGQGPEDGSLLAQDLIYHPVGSRWSGTLRYALFRTDGYASRLYMYENDLLYSFSLRPYYHHGQRFYINLRFKPWNPLTLEVRYETYRLFNQTTIGSGTEEIQGPLRTGIKFQVRYLF